METNNFQEEYGYYKMLNMCVTSMLELFSLFQQGAGTDSKGRCSLKEKSRKTILYVFTGNFTILTLLNI